MLKYIIKQLRRSIVTNALFCLLLTLAGTLLCISAGLWYSAHKALLDIDETVTTIAIPDTFAIGLHAAEIVHENFQPEWEEDTHEQHTALQTAVSNAEQEIYRTIREEIYPSGLLKMDERRLFGAFKEGITTLPLRTRGLGPEPILAEYSGQALAAFIVTFDRIDVTNSFSYGSSRYNADTETLEFDGYVYKYYIARFSVDEILQLHSVHTEPLYINISFITKNHDGSMPFEEGKQYAVFGRYSGMHNTLGTLSIEIPNVGVDVQTVGYVYSNEELNDKILGRWWRVDLPDDVFPVKIIEHLFEREFRPDDEGWYSVIEIEGSIEETKSSDRWLPMREALDIAKISADSFQIITTNDPNSLLRFNQNRNLFAEGRTFSPREITDGARVCLVSQQFAEHNDLSVGDVLPLQLYNSEFGAEWISFSESEGSGDTSAIAWIPTLYHTGLEISNPTDFTIIGIYNTLRLDFSAYAVRPNFVIIPNNSFGNLEGEPVSEHDLSMNAPILTDAMIIPNGSIDETRAVIDGIAEGYGGLFRFYDQGYNSLLVALGNLQFGMAWILVLSAAGWIAVLLIFLMFYVSRKRKEALLLYAIGISNINRFGWVFIQCAVLILLALGISIAVSLPIYGDILDIAAGAAQEFSDSFRDLRLSDAADSGLRSRIPLDRSPLALIVTVAGGALITLAAAGLLSARSVVFKSLGEKRGDD